MYKSLYELDDKNRSIELFKYCLEFQRHVSGNPCTKRLSFAEASFTKHTLNAFSILNIICPIQRVDLLGKMGTISDFPSAITLLRPMYENLLNACFVLKYEKFKNSNELVIDVVYLHANKERLILLYNMTSSQPENREKQYQFLKEQKEIIESDEKYPYMPDDAKKFVSTSINLYLKKKWNTVDLLTKSKLAGFHESQHLQIYKYSSNYIHSDGYSLQQVGAVKKGKDAENMCLGVFDKLDNLSSQFLKLYNEICIENDIRIIIPDNILEIMDMWEEFNKRDLNLEY